MNNEYESGRYGTHLKYFQNLDDYTEYLDSSTTVKARPNVAYCDGNIKYVKYNWENDTIVLSATSNSTVYNILTAANITPTNPAGFTAADLAAITLDKIYCQNGGSGGFENEDGYRGGYAELTEEERQVYEEDYEDFGFCKNGYSIFYMYGKIDWFNNGQSINGITQWEFPEFQYFTGITQIPRSMFDNCLGLTSITIPSSVTSIGMLAFHDCHLLTDVTILNSPNNVNIYDADYDYDPDAEEWYDRYNEDCEDAAFAYTGYSGMDDEFREWGLTYASPKARMIGEGYLTFQPQS